MRFAFVSVLFISAITTIAVFTSVIVTNIVSRKKLQAAVSRMYEQV
jgi:hypothetical protein